MGEIRCTLSPKAERNKKHFKWSVEFIFLSHLPINKSCTIFFCKQWLHSASIVSTFHMPIGWEWQGHAGVGRKQGMPEVWGAGRMEVALEVLQLQGSTRPLKDPQGKRSEVRLPPPPPPHVTRPKGPGLEVQRRQGCSSLWIPFPREMKESRGADRWAGAARRCPAGLAMGASVATDFF